MADVIDAIKTKKTPMLMCPALELSPLPEIELRNSHAWPTVLPPTNALNAEIPIKTANSPHTTDPNDIRISVIPKRRIA